MQDGYVIGAEGKRARDETEVTTPRKGPAAGRGGEDGQEEEEDLNLEESEEEEDEDEDGQVDWLYAMTGPFGLVPQLLGRLTFRSIMARLATLHVPH